MRRTYLVLLVLSLATLISSVEVGATKRIPSKSEKLAQVGSEIQTMLAQVGKTSTKTKSSTTKTKDSDPYGIGAFVIGTILIPFSLVLLWKNEKKIVTFQKCMDRAEKEIKTVDCNDATAENNFKLIHVTGKTENKTDLVDNDFGVSIENSYRLKRKVEVYQW